MKYKPKDYHLSYQNTLLMCSVLLLVLDPEIAGAAVATTPTNLKANTSAVFDDSYAHMRSLIFGALSKAIALAAFLGALFTGAAQGSVKVVLGCLGISFAAGAGPSVVETVTGAIF